MHSYLLAFALVHPWLCHGWLQYLAWITWDQHYRFWESMTFILACERFQIDYSVCPFNCDGSSSNYTLMSGIFYAGNAILVLCYDINAYKKKSIISANMPIQLDIVCTVHCTAITLRSINPISTHVVLCYTRSRTRTCRDAFNVQPSHVAFGLTGFFFRRNENAIKIMKQRTTRKERVKSIKFYWVTLSRAKVLPIITILYLFLQIVSFRN